ncbi:SDR family NAD(P)-dependent oxidoreductase [Peterkaempfera bronchialis]|uniref:SDR family oxidoreductase n=1 Tax=Peterkaempfera bronchialis TaxID=2126346 RepID=A0A345SZN4_9ACTN|nr:SDR family oxidoreductase [Peterkaempfera bronchialis]AXI79189.1 SDR family oxidoreductase [Peterkaempfera bronchialis]
MRVRGAVVVVTGAAGGIGAALARRFAAEGAAGLLLADLDADAVEDLAGELDRDGCRAVGVGSDVSHEGDVRTLVHTAEKHLGPIDLFCSNAGVGTAQGIDAPDALWQACWDVNVMAQVYAARAVVPGMLARGRGWLLNTASAAGLLTMPGDAPYSATKHAAVAFAEWLAVTYGGRGIGVSVLCPQGVHTKLTTDPGVAAVLGAFGPMLEPAEVADAVVAGLADERFLILPHPEVARYEQGRATDRDAWLAGMRKAVQGIAQADVPGGPGQPAGEEPAGSAV